MPSRPHALRHLTAWNEGDTEAIPDGYGPGALDWQLDLRAVLAGDPIPTILDQVNETRPPSAWEKHEWHWLDAERAWSPSISQWIKGEWWSGGEATPISPTEMYRRGYRWRAPAIPPMDDQT